MTVREGFIVGIIPYDRENYGFTEEEIGDLAFPYVEPESAPSSGLSDEQELEHHSLTEYDVEQLREWDIENRL